MNNDQKKSLYVGIAVMAAASVVVIGCSGPAYDALSKIGRVKGTESIYTPGTYEWESQGFGGAVKAVVTVDDANITDLVLTGDGETPELGGKALSTLKAGILKNQTIEVDSVSGATITSDAVKEAVGNALALARGEVVEEAAEAAEVELATDGKFNPGTYEAEVRGMRAMKIAVTFDKDAITDIQVEHEETPGIGEPVVEQMTAQILEVQGLGLDAVSGATLTSNAMLNGVAECARQAGADVEALKAIKPSAAEKEADQELETDVLVIGAGGAGMAAAVQANQLGKNVIVVEKSQQMGGNTILSGGAFNAVEDGSEMAQKYEDSVEKHYTQTFNGGDQQAKPELVRTLVEHGWEAVDWLKDLGMEFKDTPITVAGGLWQRGQQPVEPEGTGFFIVYQKYMDEHEGVEVLYNTTAKSLIVEDGAVTGVVCEGKTGNQVTIRANGGVVLATGGFSGNVELRMEALKDSDKWPTLDDTVKTTNSPNVTGDGILMAEEVGANLIQMENIQLLPLGDPQTGSLSGNIGHGATSFIFVNKEGKRFTDEGGRRDDMTLDLFKQTDHFMYMIMDSDTYPNGNELNNFGEHINDLVNDGRAYKADTLEELAEMLNVPTETFLATIEEYNRHCPGGDLEGQEDEFGRTLFTDGEKKNNGINTAPFYAAGRVPTVHHTMGGVEINTDTEVLDKDGNVIPGLYAAGEVTGGIHGTNRLGGNALTDTIVFGRIAGEKAAGFTR